MGPLSPDKFPGRPGCVTLPGTDPDLPPKLSPAEEPTPSLVPAEFLSGAGLFPVSSPRPPVPCTPPPVSVLSGDVPGEPC